MKYVRVRNLVQREAKFLTQESHSSKWEDPLSHLRSEYKIFVRSNQCGHTTSIHR